MYLIKALNTQTTFVFDGISMAVVLNPEDPSSVKRIWWVVVEVLPPLMIFN
jgi:hypothetical protein